MDILSGQPEIFDFLSPVDADRLRMTCKQLYKNEKYITYLINSKFNIKLANEVSNMALAEFGVRFSKKSIHRKKYRNFYFLRLSLLYEKKKGCKRGLFHLLKKFFFKQEDRPKYFIYTHNSLHQVFIKNIIYFEATLKKECSVKNCISIGFALKSVYYQCVDLSFLLGWLDNSVGLHSDDGNIYYNSSKIRFVRVLRVGDTVGFGFDINNNVLFFVLNGILVYKIQEIYSNNFVPCIIADVNIDEFIMLNYGDAPFHFALQNYY